MIRGQFEFSVAGSDTSKTLFMAGSEWHLFHALRDLSRARAELEWFENYGAPLAPQSLAALNLYLRTGAMRFWKSKRWDEGRELLGTPEWRRFVRMLGLKFDGRGTRRAA